MPAFLKTLFYPTIGLTILFLVGCSRDNPLSVPDEYITQEEINCDVDLLQEPLLTDINITDTSLTYVLEGNIQNSFAHDVNKYDAKVDHLINSVVITPVIIDITSFNEIHREGINELSTIDVKISDDISDSEIIDSEINLTEQTTNVKILVTATFSVFQSIQEGSKCVPVFETDDSGDPIFETDASGDFVFETDESGDLIFETDGTGNLIPIKIPVIKTEDKARRVSYTIEMTRNQFEDLSVTPIELSNDISSADDEFGHAISLGNTLETSTLGIAVGVHHDNTDINDSGAVYIYEQLPNNEWNNAALIKAAKPDPGDKFGYSVSLSNGFLAVSAVGEDSSSRGIFPWKDEVGDNENDNIFAEINNTSKSSGAVYLFKKDDEEPNRWKQVAFIKQPAVTIGTDNIDTGFGQKVLLKDNVLLVAAPQQKNATVIDEITTNVSSGVVYVYRYVPPPTVTDPPTPGTWSLATTLKSSTPRTGDDFGSALSMYDGSILIGASGENNGTGAAHLFSPNGVVWQFSTRFAASISDEGDAFGTSVALSPTKVFIGANKEDSAGKALNREKEDDSLENSGAVYGYTNDSSESWAEFVYIKADEPQAGAQFGYDIKFNDGNLIIGSPFRSNANSLGQAFTYELIEKEIQPSSIILFESIETTVTTENTQANARFGSSIALFENVFAIGANGFSNKETGMSKTHSGKAYIFQ